MDLKMFYKKKKTDANSKLESLDKRLASLSKDLKLNNNKEKEVIKKEKSNDERKNEMKKETKSTNIKLNTNIISKIKTQTNIKKIKPQVEKIEKAKDTEAKVENVKAIQPKAKKLDKVYIMPIGGLHEIGKNMMLYQYRDEIIIIDVGVNFPDDTMLGIDLVIPDFTYVEKNISKVKSILLTHGHEDHVGALPYLYKSTNFSVPVYGSKLTIELAKEKFKSRAIKEKDIDFKVIPTRKQVKLGKYFTAEFIKVTHSIPDACSIALHTPIGTIIHTGDFKIDLTPINGESIDFYKFAELGEKGVLALLSDSTNSERSGYTASEKTVGASLLRNIEKLEGRVIVATFATNVHRIQQIFDIARKCNRKIALDGRSMHKVVEIASKNGYLDKDKDIIIDVRNVKHYKDNQVLVLCTGTQGEPLAALTRIAKQMHKHIFLNSNDTIVMSATPIPGNENAVNNTLNLLLKADANVVYEKDERLHTSGHASELELKLMLNLIKPKFFIPVHGEYRHLKKHQNIAVEIGVPKENSIIISNGMRIELTKESIKESGKIPSGEVLIDGLGIGDVGDAVLKDRHSLSESGIFIIMIKFDRKLKKTLENPEVITKGFVYTKHSKDIVDHVLEKVNDAIINLNSKNVTESSTIKYRIKEVINKSLYEKMKRNPVVIPLYIEEN